MGVTVSMVQRCDQTETRPISFDDIWAITRDGGHGLKEKINQIRNRYEAEKDITGNPEKAKKAIAELKLQLPGFLPSGTFSKRESSALVEHSGRLCADCDSLGERLPAIRGILKALPYVYAIALSPSGDGLKVFFNVLNDPARHEDSFRAIQSNMRDLEIEIDEKCKDLSRICFFTYDPDLWIREDGNEVLPPADPLPRGKPVTQLPTADTTRRELIAIRLLGELRPAPEKGGYFVNCPGINFHTNKDNTKQTILYLEGAPTLDCQHESCGHVVEAFNKVLRSEIGKAERQQSPISNPYRDSRLETLTRNGAESTTTQPLRDFVTFYSVSAVKSYVPPPGLALVGDYHIVRGSVTVIAGPPGVGKSRATVYLSVCGATGENFFGLSVHSRFKTMILQCENGLYRLKSEFAHVGEEFDDFIRISDPPPYGFLFKRSDFRAFVKDKIAEFLPGVLVIDPWNRVEHGQDSRDYLDTFDLVHSILPESENTPALVINAHHRKSGNDGVGSGRDLLKELSGGLALGSVPRTVFAMLHATNAEEETRVVWTCCKNNDGELGKRSAWERKDGNFLPATIDWAEFDSATKADKRVTITDEMIEECFESGAMIRSLARDKLMEISGATRGAVYKCLSPKGRFSDQLIFSGDTINYLRK
jgi:hypothetical protein